MARVTVEDCVQKIPNRFDLVMVAAQRARDITAGSSLTVDRDNDKNPVVALREIADETISIQDVEDSLVKGLQRHVETDEPEEDEMDLLAIQQELGIAGTEVPAVGLTSESGEEADSNSDEQADGEAEADDDADIPENFDVGDAEAGADLEED